jgi:chromosome condensin MukBEF ATPase and DNA-binding subunit MukB
MKMAAIAGLVAALAVAAPLQAQHDSHSHSHSHSHSQAHAEHSPVQRLLANHAEVGLTAEQVAQLETIQARLEARLAEIGTAGTGADEARKAAKKEACRLLTPEQKRVAHPLICAEQEAKRHCEKHQAKHGGGGHSH